MRNLQDIKKYLEKGDSSNEYVVAEIQALVKEAIPEEDMSPERLEKESNAEMNRLEGYSQAITDITTALIERGLLAKGEDNG